MKILKKLSDRLGARGRTLLLSLAVAVLVWYGIRVLTGFSTLVTGVPVEIQAPPGWIVLEPGRAAVDIAFMGTREDQRLLNRDQVKVSVDLRTHTDTAPCVHRFAAADINAPGSPFVERTSPEQIVVRMDRQASKQVPVRLYTQNMLPAGYEQQAPVITPATIQLTGPESVLSRIDSLSTQPVDLDGRIRTFTRRGLRLEAPSGDGAAHVRMDPPTVTIELPIVERSSTVSFDGIPIALLCPPGQALQASVVPDTASVTLKGPPELADALSPSDVRLFVDATGADGTAPVLRPLRADLPDRISLVRTDPPQARVHLAFGDLRSDP